MPYIVCKKCGGYYKLKEGESIDDFDRCPCGGDIKYVESLDDLKKMSVPSQSPKTKGNIIDDAIKWWNGLTTNSKIGVVALCCFGALLLIGIGGLLSPDKTTETTTQPSTTTTGEAGTPVQSPNATTTEPTTTSAGGIEILSTSGSWDSIVESYIIVGEVKNNYNTEVSLVKIVGTGYDSSGKVVATDFTFADLDKIPSGGKSPFKLYLDDPDQKIVRYELKAEA